MKNVTRTYRGWKIGTQVGTKSGITIYGDNLVDLKRRIDAFMSPPANNTK